MESTADQPEAAFSDGNAILAIHPISLKVSTALAAPGRLATAVIPTMPVRAQQVFRLHAL